MKHAFTKSEYFKPWLKEEQDRRVKEGVRQRMRRNKVHQKVEVKVGHGGTLDPGATGCLVIGIGKGTKQLQTFIESRKSYDATILFGAATNSYDTFGKILATAPYEHITKDQVENSLEQFRGDIKQQPPIFSALKMDGKALYEYARAGKDLPREISFRPAKVYSLNMIEWLEPGSHGLTWPSENASKDEISAGYEVLQLNESRPADSSEHDGKRKRSASPQSIEARKEQKNIADPADYAIAPLEELVPSQPDEIPDRPPAAKLRMDVGSGFYVRSLCHDLGKAVGSLGLMAGLVRTKQGPFSLETNVLAYEDLKAGEEVWTPKIQTAFQEWEKHLDSISAALEKQT